MSFSNAPTTFYLNVATFTTAGIESTGNVTYNATQGSFRITYKPPSTLAPAVYQDTVTVRMCGDQACNLVLSTASLPVTFTVTAPAGGTLPLAVLNPTTHTQNALFLDQAAGTVTLSNAFTFTNFAVTPVVRVNPVVPNAAVTATYAQTDATHGSVTLTFRAPNLMTVGASQVAINFQVCLDAACVNTIPAGTFTLNVTYNVGNSTTVAGANGYTLAVFPVYPLTARGMAASTTRERIYVSAGTNSGSHANQLLELDPQLGTIATAALPAGRMPAAVALSDDDQYVYAVTGGSTDRVRIADLGLDATIPAGGVSIDVAPGLPQTLAVASSSGTLRVVDGLTVRPVIAGFGTAFFDFAQWGSDATQLFAQFDVAGAPPSTCRYVVDPTGVTDPRVCGEANASTPATFGNGLLYAYGGNILSPTNLAITATLSVPGAALLKAIPDVTSGKIFVFVLSDTNGCSLQSFDLTTRAAIASVRLPSLAAANLGRCGYQNELVRWGANGLALAAIDSGPETYIVTVKGAFVAP